MALFPFRERSHRGTCRPSQSRYALRVAIAVRSYALVRVVLGSVGLPEMLRLVDIIESDGFVSAHRYTLVF